MDASVGRSLVAAFLLVSAACGPAKLTGVKARTQAPGAGAPTGGGDPGGAGPAFNLPDGGSGSQDAAAALRPDASCGLQRHRLTRLPPELLLVLDRSGSMRELAEGTANTRWDETVAALDEVLARTDGSILWGLKSFPSPEGCEVLPEVEVPIGPASQPVLEAVRTTLPNDGAAGTPTSVAIEAGNLYLRSLRSLNPKYLVVATDGLPTCPQTDHLLAEQNTIAAITAARNAGFPTFVIGIATAGTDADRVLGSMAMAGGQPRAATPPYYPVDDRQTLVSALGQIARVVETCTFPLDRDAPSPDDVAVNIDGMRIMRDPTRRNGWDYGAGNRVIELHGAACEIVKSGGVLNLEIVFGCPHIPIP